MAALMINCISIQMTENCSAFQHFLLLFPPSISVQCLILLFHLIKSRPGLRKIIFHMKDIQVRTLISKFQILWRIPI